MHPTEIWFGKSAKARVLRTLLTPLSWLYMAGWQGYLALYRLGIKESKEPHKPVVVIGNLTTGGTGKTPVTLYVAKLLMEMGEQVVIGCSGYGSPHSEGCEYAPPGDLDPGEWGDEPAMLRWFLPEVEILVGRSRVRAANLLHDRCPDAVLLMDDGFQHLPLKNHVSIVIEDPSPENEACLPSGPYREPRSNLNRADAVIWTSKTARRSDRREFTLSRSPTRLVTPAGDEAHPTKATLLCAIGQPERFLAETRKRVEVIAPLNLPDHDPLTSGNLLESLPSDLPVIVTAKDWVKLRLRKDVGTREFILALQDVHIEPESDFRAWLAEKLNESKAKQGAR